MNVQAAELGKPGTVAVGLRSHGGTGMRAARVDEKGEAEVQQVPPGEYEVVLFSRDRRYSISRISAEGAEVNGRRLTSLGTSTTIAPAKGFPARFATPSTTTLPTRAVTEIDGVERAV